MQHKLDELNLEEESVLIFTGDIEEHPQEIPWCECEQDAQIEKVVFWLSKAFVFDFRVFGRDTNVVYRARPRHKSRQHLCLKFFASTGSRLPNEIRFLEQIRRQGGHPNLPVLLEVYQYRDIFVMITKFEKDEHLPTTTTRIVKFMKQIVSAVEFCHTNNIIHRDIKPSNLLWNDSKQHLIVCDFDLSAWNDKEGHQREVGTAGFMASEISEMEDSVYFKEIDVYSIGAVLGCMIHGAPGDNIAINRVKIWRREIKKCMKDKKETTTGLQRLFVRLTHSSPNKRISLADCLSELNAINLREVVFKIEPPILTKPLLLCPNQCPQIGLEAFPLSMEELQEYARQEHEQEKERKASFFECKKSCKKSKN